MTGFSMKCNTGLKWVNSLQVSEAYLNPVKNVSVKDRFYNKFHQRLNMFSIAQDFEFSAGDGYYCENRQYTTIMI